MNSSEHQETPINEQLLELLVYAPIGLVYEYQAVWETLVKRGKSQVNLARMMARMAAQNKTGDGDETLNQLVEGAGAWLATAIDDFGQLFGLIANESPSSDGTDEPASSQADEPTRNEGPNQGQPDVEGRVGGIENYGDMTVAQIRPLLGSMSDFDLAEIRAHEATNKGRNSILNHIDRLLA